MITTELTGDAFIDLGRSAILRLAGKDTVDDGELRAMVRQQTEVYVHDWASKLNAFFLNCPITQPAYKTPEDKIARTLDMFDEAFDGSLNGYCEICGQHAHVVHGDRTNMPLSGSANEVNFHPSFSAGIDLCPECLAALYFLPVAVLQAGGQPLALQARTKVGYEAWLQSTVDRYRTAKGKGLSKGPEKTPLTLPNAVYATAVHCVQLAGRGGIGEEELTFFSFTNFGASARVDVLVVPHHTLLYLSHVEPARDDREHRDSAPSCSASVPGSTAGLSNYLSAYPDLGQAWHAFLNAGRVSSGKRNRGVIEGDNTWLVRNRFIEKLINGSSLLRDMREQGVPFHLAALYGLEVLGMEQQRLSKLMQLGKNIVEYERKQKDLKIVHDLEAAESSTTLRAALRRAARRYAETEGTPLLAATDLVQWVVPDSARWDETRDILLVYLYEQLADTLKKGESAEKELSSVEAVTEEEGHE